MGTHPIFESDFDCLTEFRMSTDKISAISKTDDDLVWTPMGPYSVSKSKMRRELDYYIMKPSSSMTQIHVQGLFDTDNLDQEIKKKTGLKRSASLKNASKAK